MLRWIDVLNKLAAVGPALQEAWPILLVIITNVQLLIDKLAKLVPSAVPSEGLEQYNKTEEELAAEAKVAALLTAPGTQAMVDLATLFTLWRTAQQIPKVAAVLTQLLDLLSKFHE